MVSKNNIQVKDRYSTKQVPHYGIRKLSVGVASVLLSTTLYMGVTAHADTIAETNPQPTIDQPVNTKSGTSTGDATIDVYSKPTADQSASTATNSPVSETNASSKPVQTVSPEQPADTTAVQPASDQLESAAANSSTSENGANTQSASAVLPKQPANVADTQPAAEVGAQPFMNLAVASDNNELAPKRETVDSTWTVHYVNQADHKQELKDPTVITMQYTRTNTPQSDGTTQYGDWSYVPGSFKQTGTPITIKDSDNPVKQDNIDKNGENMDVFTITAMYPTVAGYEFHDGVNGTRLHDNLRNNERQADTMSGDFYAEYDVAKERSVAVKFVDDQSYDSDTIDHKKQVGQAVTVTGRDGDTVDVKLTVPDKYQLADGQQLPTSYTFAKGSGDLTIHLVHQVVQREATIDVQLGLVTFVDFGDNSYEPAVITQAQWEQVKEEEAKDGPVRPGGEIPFTEVGTLTGHVGYDLVDEEAVSFGDDWTSLNLGGRTYQLPNGTDVVNGISIDSEDSRGEKLRAYVLADDLDIDPDYVNRPWHGYLSVNATNNSQTPGSEDIIRLGLQAGLAGNESNILAKVTGDRAATAVEMVNKTIDLNWLQDHLDFGVRDFNEQDGQLRAKTGWEAFGVYIPYVEKTATRTIKVTTPDGKTTTVEQTATLAKQIDFGKDAHPAWTTGEWVSYNVPTIPGYTASQSNVAKETVTGTTKDQTVNITYTANEHQISIEYVDNATGHVVKTDHMSGKTAQTVSITPHIPDGWELVSGQLVPSEVTLGADGAPATVIKVQPQERSVAVKFVDDQSHEQQVGKVITVTGRDGGTVDLNLTVPDKYQLADGQQLPTAYTFKKGSGDLTIHLVHQVVQREAAIDVQLGLMTTVDNGVDDDGALTIGVTQNHWKQLNDDIKDSKNPNSNKVFPSVKVGTLTGHVNYDLVDNKVVSFNDDWTHLNLGGQTYQMPDGTEVVNGVSTGSVDSWGKSLKEQLLKYHPDTDPDYVNRPWHGYLSVNETNEIAPDFTSDNLQAGLVGDESNALAKANGDRAATVVKMANKTIDSNWLKNHFNDFEFSEQNGQLQADGFVPVVGVYIPYVEKTATRTINITTPGGKTTTVKQIATLAKQIDFGEDVHPEWTTSEWASYDVPTIPGYTVSQSSVAKEAVTGTTKDQTVNITYTANPQTSTVVYQTEDGTPVHTTTVNGHTGQTVKVSNEVPVGWHVVNGNVPSEITFGPNGIPKTVITIAHSHVTLTPDAPKTTSDKLPDNPGKTYPAGVSHDDLNKTVTGTIKVTMPDGQVKTVVKTAKLTRTADVDEVTGKVTYSDWTTGYWSAYTAPSVPGYTANYPYIAGQSVGGETEDQTIEITYTANEHQISVEYVDTATGQVVKTDHMSGKTGQTVSITPHIPDGWELVSGQSVPSEVILGADGAPATVIKVQPQERSVAVKFVDDQSDGRQVGQAITLTGRDGDTTDLNLIVPDKYQLADGQQLPTTYTFTKGSGDVTVHLKHGVHTESTKLQVVADIQQGLYYPWISNEDGNAYLPFIGHASYGDMFTNGFPEDRGDIVFNIGSYDLSYKADSVTGAFIDWVGQSGITISNQVFNVPTNDVLLNGSVRRNRDLFDVLEFLDKHTSANIGTSWELQPISVDLTNMIGGSGPEFSYRDKFPSYSLTRDNTGNIEVSLQSGETKLNVDDINSFPMMDDTHVIMLPLAIAYTPVRVKNIHRIINVIKPDGKTETIDQQVKLTAQSKKDPTLSTSAAFDKRYNVVFDNWSMSQWDQYTPPVVSGYTASQPVVAETTVTDQTNDQTVKITYTANPQTTTVVYQSADGTPVHTTTINGQTNQTVKIPNETPAGWTVVKGQVPGELTFGADGHDSIEVTVAHQHVTVTPDHPQDNGTKLPDNPAKTFNGVEANDLNKTITRTIKVATPDGQTKTVVQTAKLTRTATVDEVTGEVAYGNWTTDEWAAYDAPSVAGYVPNQTKVDKETVTASSKDTTTVITYLPTQHQISVEYVDDDDHGKVVKTDQVPGKTDQTITVTPSAPANYDLVDNGNRTYTVTSGDGQRVQIHVKHHQVTTSESKTVTRTINIDAPHDGTTVFKQAVDLSRDVTTDQVTGDKTYGDWSMTEWTHYDVPAVAGYTPSIKQVAQQVVDGTTEDQTVNVTYTANAQTTHVNYVDGNGNAVHTTMITGKTDQTVKVPNETPAGWKVVGEAVPTEITFGPDGHADVAVTVDHQHVTVTPDDPKTPADKLPNNPGKTYPDGVGHNDLNRTVTRTIKVVTPDGQTKMVTQTAKLTRTADVDEATGEVTYGDWTTDEWAAYDVPAVAGYTPSQSEVSATKVTDTTKNQTVTIGYTANNQTTHVNYVDGNGKTVHMTTITGKTDQMVKVPNETPAGWTIVGEPVPTELAFGPDGHADVTVTISHKHVTVTPDQPKTSSDKLPDNPAKTYPSGVGHDDLNKTITRTIKITTPDSQTKTTKQAAKLTRTADIDEVTGKVTYGNWTTGEWSNYDVPAVPGYTPSQSEVPATKVTDDIDNQTVTISYTANDQTTTIDYVDHNGKTVYTTVVNGHTDQTVKVPNETPAGWTITNGQVPTEITFGPDGHADVTVTIDHQHVTVTPDKPQTDGTKLPDNPSQTFHGVTETDLNKTITRTIEVATPAGKTDTIKQTDKLTRTADVDEVTGEVTYGKWTTGAWSSYNVPTVPGYTPSQSVVAEAAVYADTTDQTVKITYMADSHMTHINYVDENGNVVHTTTVTGQTDQTVKVPNETPAGWTITTGQVPSEVTFEPDGYTDVTITVDHRYVTVTPDDPKTDGTQLPDNPTLTFRGVGKGDLNKTVTRTIKLNVPGQAPQVITQTSHLTRTATVDEVTGEVIYGDWTSGQWDAYEVPTVDGHTASQTTIPAVNVTSETTSQDIVIDYVAVPTASNKQQPTTDQATSATPTAPLQSPVANGTVQETKQDTIKNSAQSTMQDTNQLPQTGNDNRAGLLSLIGSSLMASLAVFGLGKKKKHEN